MTYPNLFQELDSCVECPSLTHTRGKNQHTINKHLDDTHAGINATAFVIAKRKDGERKQLQQIYQKAAAYLDDDFHLRFLREFDELCWELMVFKQLRELGIKIFPHKKVGPDFDTEIGYIECVCVKRGEGDNAIPLHEAARIDKDGKIHGNINFQLVPVDEMKLRVSSGFFDKQKVYKRYVDKKYIDPSRPRIIALNWYAEGSASMSSNDDFEYSPAFQALFGTGNPEIVIDTKSNKVIETRISHSPTTAKKDGRIIDMGYFAKEADDNNFRIDGVILSNSLPAVMRLNNVVTFNNPMSKVRYDLDSLNGIKRYRAQLDAKSGMIKVERL